MEEYLGVALIVAVGFAVVATLFALSMAGEAREWRKAYHSSEERASQMCEKLCDEQVSHVELRERVLKAQQILDGEEEEGDA